MSRFFYYFFPFLNILDLNNTKFKAAKNTTKIIIAQRVSSVEHADKIIILDGGKIVACGNHETLMQTSEIYREIYEAQTQGKTKQGGEA